MFFPGLIQAQDLNYARYLVDTLAAPGMHGRGYVNGGDSIASVFIAQEFRKHGLDSFSPGYFQPFHFPVNIFPGRVTVSINGKPLRPGIDFITDPASPPVSGKFKIRKATGSPAREIPDQAAGQFILLDKSSFPAKGALDSAKAAWMEAGRMAGGILFTEEKKLTWSVGGGQASLPVLQVLKNSMPDHPRNIRATWESDVIENHTARNVAGFIPGTKYPDSFIVFTAHYDHLGRMGQDVYFPGANDNASGTAMMLNLVRYYSGPANRPACSMVFIAFAGEEAGLKGSEFYTGHPFFPLSNIRFLVNMDLMGTGDDGMMVVNGAVFQREFEILTSLNDSLNYLKTIGKRGKAKNSDHYYFTEKGVPSFFFYTLGGTSFYHDVYDRASTLPLTKFAEVFRLIRDFTAVLQR